MAQYGLNPFAVNMKFKVGRLTGNQAFSTWSLNNFRKWKKEAETRMFKAAAFCRTDMRRSFGRKTKSVKGRNGYYWSSSRPSAAGSPPRKKLGKGKAGLQFVTFDQEKQFVFRIGSDMFPSEGYGAQTKFHGDIMHNAGGTGIVNLPLHPDQIPAGSYRQAVFANQVPWPMAPKVCHYPKRNYLETPKKKTIKQFPRLFANLDKRTSRMRKD